MEKPTKPELQLLRNAALGMGVLRKNDPGVLSALNIAYHPYATSQDFYDLISRLSHTWHKLMCLAAWDDELINRIYRPIAEVDPYIRQNLKLYEIRRGRKDEFNFSFARTDFINDRKGDPKITEFYAMSISFMYESQALTDAKILTDFNNEQRYFENRAHDKLWQAVGNVFKKKNLQGILLLVAGPRECDDFEFSQMEISLLRQKVRTLRCNLAQAGQFLTLKEDKSLFYHDQEVSFVYYMDGYVFRNYEPEVELSWKARRLVQESNVIRSPGVDIDLALQKRMQSELSKPEVLCKYLSKQEMELLLPTIVPIYDFDSMSEEEFKVLLEDVLKNEGKYILKPNAEGGGNNFFGAEVGRMLTQMSPQQRRAFILQEKIVSEATTELILEPARINYEYIEHRLINVSQAQFEALIKDAQAQPERFILKFLPNSVDRYEGREVHLMLRRLPAEERKNYIVEEITQKQLPMLLTGGGVVRELSCDREFGHFEVIQTEGHQITRNEIVGYLMRTRPTTCNEGGVMKGGGSVTAWIRSQ